jgi:biopolymer transport protein ExbD
MAEMNVLPLIDILLVLLVIFMLIPAQRGLDAELPQQQESAGSPEPQPVVVQVLVDGTLQVNQQPVRFEALADRLDEIFKARPVRVAFVQGDNRLDFEAVAGVIALMRERKIRVGLLPPDVKPAH